MRRALAAAVLLIAGCAEPECEYDTDCKALQICEANACVPLDLRKAIAGVCTGQADCSFGELCVEGRCSLPVDQQEIRCRFERDPQCPDGTLCRIIEADPCAEGQSCEAPLACRSPAGATRSLRPCATSEECESGTCADGVCVRICNDALSCPPGFDCAPLALDGGHEVTRCVGFESDGTLDPTIAICRREADCAEGHSCRFADPARCGELGLTATCTAVPPRAYAEFGSLCYNFSSDEYCQFWGISRSPMCPAQLCGPSCEPESSTAATVCTERRCSQPCESTEDCPLGTLCQQLGNEVPADGEPAKQCGIIEGGCWDQVDCCPQRDVNGLCTYGWGVTEGFCGLQQAGPTTLRYCVQPDGLKALPEGACVTDADCLTGLCEPTLDGAGKSCTTLCVPDRDRCSMRQPGRTCAEPTIERLPGLHVCR